MFSEVQQQHTHIDCFEYTLFRIFFSVNALHTHTLLLKPKLFLAPSGYLFNSCSSYVACLWFNHCRLKPKLWVMYRELGVCLLVCVHVCMSKVGEENCKPFLFPALHINVSLGLPHSDCSFSSCCFLIGSLSCETGQLMETHRGVINNRIGAPFRLVHHESERA